MLQLTKQSSESELKQYFASVLELTKSDNKYPINLDDVWPLVYSLKNKAVRALKENFFENEDFITVTQNGQGGKFDRTDYYLTTSCLEYFIARKVRPVFEVYRQVFHKAVQQPSLPTTYKDALKQLLLQVEANEHLQIENEKQRILLEDREVVIGKQTEELEKAAPKVQYYDNVMQSTTTYTVQQIAKELDMTANKLYAYLKEKKVMFKQSGIWMLATKYGGKGYTKMRTHTFTRSDGTLGTSSYTVITELGRRFIHEIVSKCLQNQIKVNG